MKVWVLLLTEDPDPMEPNRWEQIYKVEAVYKSEDDAYVAWCGTYRHTYEGYKIEEADWYV